MDHFRVSPQFYLVYALGRRQYNIISYKRALKISKLILSSISIADPIHFVRYIFVRVLFCNVVSCHDFNHILC